MGDFGCLLVGCLLEIVWGTGKQLGECCEKQVVNSYWVLNIYCYNGCLLENGLGTGIDQGVLWKLLGIVYGYVKLLWKIN